MGLPPELQDAVRRELEGVDRALLSRASSNIRESYERGEFRTSLSTREARAAYLLTRLPATYAANRYVFAEIVRLSPILHPQTLLDLGAGPGTSLWAAREFWPEIQSTLIESNEDFLKLGARLAPDSKVQWLHQDISRTETFPDSEIVILSYALGELKEPERTIERAWHATGKVLVIVEPGTPRNFAAVAAARAKLIAAGAFPMAPCPHANECPMAAAGDWCHFAVRLERSSEHRRLKGGTLGYEDEKFSYLAFSKTPVDTAPARIVRHPLVHGGHIQLTLCTPQGLVSETVTRAAKDAFRAARKARWGDCWDRHH
jgi:ribosomal protein RSM22 (predicted rRNA methylase)